MKEILVALVVGLIIGAVFRLIKLPVPVPHGWAGMAGLIGMFTASEVFPLILKLLEKKQG